MGGIYHKCRCYGDYEETANIIKSKINEWLKASVSNDKQLDVVVCYLSAKKENVDMTDVYNGQMTDCEIICCKKSSIMNKKRKLIEI